jgi:hypothetical protein
MQITIIILCLLLILALLLSAYSHTLYTGTDEPKIMYCQPQEYTPEQASDFIRIMKQYSQGFEPLTSDLMKIMRSEVGPDWTDEQIISSWYWLRSTNATRSYDNLGKIPRAVLENANHTNVLALSKTYHVGPLAIARKTLKEQGLPDSLVSSYINNPSMIPDDQQYAMVVKAWEHDSETPTSYKILFDKARAYEIQIENDLTQAGVLFKTQEDLTREQMKTHGRAVCTPDILFIEPVVVMVTHPDGNVTEHRVNWIDAKNYMFIHGGFITKKIMKQASEYVKHFGPGALMFHYGFVNTPQLEQLKPDVVMLSGTLRV